jgi:hypothetical protein
LGGGGSRDDTDPSNCRSVEGARAVFAGYLWMITAGRIAWRPTQTPKQAWIAGFVMHLSHMPNIQVSDAVAFMTIIDA